MDIQRRILCPALFTRIGRRSIQSRRLFREVQNRSGAPLYRSNRSGILQLGRWSLETDAELEHGEQELSGVTTTATTCILLLAAKFLAHQNRPGEYQAVEALATDNFRRSA
jgi:hypothetical protein